MFETSIDSPETSFKLVYTTTAQGSKIFANASSNAFNIFQDARVIQRGEVRAQSILIRMF